MRYLVLKNQITEDNEPLKKDSRPLVVFKADSKDECVEFAIRNEQPFTVYVVVEILASYVE